MQEVHTGLFSLPVELLRAILDLLGPGDLSSTRLTCSALALLGDDNLPTEVYLVFKRDRFQRLVDISRRPEVAKCIKSLHYDAERFDRRPQHFERWNHDRRCCDLGFLGQDGYTFDEELPPPDSTYLSEIETLVYQEELMDRTKTTWLEFRKKLGLAYNAYKRLLLDEKKISSDKFDLHCLSTLLERCPSLETITLSHDFQSYHHHAPGGTLTRRHRAFRDILNEPRRCEESGDSGKTSQKALNTLLDALTVSRKALNSLTIAGVDYRILDQLQDVSR